MSKLFNGPQGESEALPTHGELVPAGLTCSPLLFVPSQIAIPVVSVTNIKKTKTAILVPNALVIATANDRVREERETFLEMIQTFRTRVFLFLFVVLAVRIRVIDVQRQHLQVPDVGVSSSGGRSDFCFIRLFSIYNVFKYEYIEHRLVSQDSEKFVFCNFQTSLFNHIIQP